MLEECGMCHMGSCNTINMGALHSLGAKPTQVRSQCHGRMLWVFRSDGIATKGNVTNCCTKCIEVNRGSIFLCIELILLLLVGRCDHSRVGVGSIQEVVSHSFGATSEEAGG